MASRPSRYQLRWSPRNLFSAQNASAPARGPSMRPMPPMTTKLRCSFASAQPWRRSRCFAGDPWDGVISGAGHALVGGPCRQAAQLLVDRGGVGGGHVEQLPEAGGPEVGWLVAVDPVACAHGARQLQRQALGLGALHGVGQLACGTQNARAIGPQPIALADQTEFDRVPVQAAEQFAGPQFPGFEAALAVALHVV